MDFIIIVKVNGLEVYRKELRIANNHIPRVGDMICYGDGEASKVTKVEWDFENRKVYVVAGA